MFLQQTTIGLNNFLKGLNGLHTNVSASAAGSTHVNLPDRKEAAADGESKAKRSGHSDGTGTLDTVNQ